MRPEQTDEEGRMMLAIKHVLEDSESQADVKAVLELVKNQNEY